MNLKESFKRIYHEYPTHGYQAPARVNLIGEHIDYNGGQVLPCAISRYIKALVSIRKDNIIEVHSKGFKKGYSINLSNIHYDEKFKWSNYVFGVFYTLKSSGYEINHGLNILLESDIPLASGLSSSAALLVLIAYLATDIYKLKISLKNIAKLAQKVEISYCGLKCGIMDQAAIALGKKDKCLLLDCANFTYDYIDFDLGKYTFVILKTNKPRSLIESKYNERVEECNHALEIIKTKFNIKDLCELRIEQLEDVKTLLDNDLLFRRVKHVVSENHRVYQFIEALKQNNISLLGQLLNESHHSLKHDYEVTGEHLDTLVESALKAKAIGARMTGAGFGGCAIALIEKKLYRTFKKEVENSYFQAIGINGEVFSVEIVDGPKKVAY